VFSFYSYQKTFYDYSGKKNQGHDPEGINLGLLKPGEPVGLDRNCLSFGAYPGVLIMDAIKLLVDGHAVAFAINLQGIVLDPDDRYQGLAA
jgi:hypothetical protein